MSILLEITI